jgi:hypothetical protein
LLPFFAIPRTRGFNASTMLRPIEAYKPKAE